MAMGTALTAARDVLLSAASELTPPIWARPSPNDGWSALDTLAHLVAAEEGMCARVGRALAGDGALPADFDLDRWNRRQVEKRRGLDPEELMAGFAAARAATLRLLDSLSDDQLALAVEHPANRQATVGWVFERIAQHQLAHTDDIRRALG
jgi:uncharacterized protein (TIGR03083 family)